jgi:hypothetical protein
VLSYLQKGGYKMELQEAIQIRKQRYQTDIEGINDKKTLFKNITLIEHINISGKYYEYITC